VGFNPERRWSPILQRSCGQVVDFQFSRCFSEVVDELDKIGRWVRVVGMSANGDQLHEVPPAWMADVTHAESLFDQLRLRHSGRDVAQIIVLASERSLSARSGVPDAVGAALVRGVRVREQLKESEGGHVSAEKVREFLGGMSKEAVLQRYRKGRLLGWREGRQNSVRFPVWQFVEGGMMPGIEEVISLLKSSPSIDDWAAILFFLNRRKSLDDQRPLDVLRQGGVEAVKRAALEYSE